MNTRQSGIALLEALLATVILAIGMLGTIGLQARAQSAINEAGLRAEATIAADALLGVMVNDQANLANYALAAGEQPGVALALWHARTVAAIPGATVLVSVTPAADLSLTTVVVSISWTRKAGGPSNTHVVTSHLAQS